MIVYGIKNCNTMKKAFTWLDEHQIAYEFVDYRKPYLSQDTLQEILKRIDLSALVNKKSTAWRGLSESEKGAVMNQSTAIQVLQAHPTLIKRPLIIGEDQLIVGFDAARYEKEFAKK